jgi:hypothetical protein
VSPAGLHAAEAAGAGCSGHVLPKGEQKQHTGHATSLVSLS